MIASHFEFSHTDKRLGRVRFVACRESLSLNGDVESDFLAGVTDVRRHQAGGSFARALGAALTTPEADILVIIRNPRLVLDCALAGRLAAAIAALPGDDWAIAGAGGLGLAGQRHLALYASAAPALPDQSGIQPIVDVLPDLTLVNADYARWVFDELPSLPDQGFEPVLATAGYLDGRVSVFLPQLSAGIDGDLAARDVARLAEDLSRHFGTVLNGQPVATLSGPVEIRGEGAAPPPTERRDLGVAIAETVGARAHWPGLSIVTRTRFARPHLLRRLLTSISRARRDDMHVEIVLSTDAEPASAEAALAELRDAFAGLDLRLQINDAPGPSRVVNLLGGIRAATQDYVAIVDDDDFLDLFAFEALGPAFFQGNRPLIVTGSEVHEERWEETPSGRAVLSSSTPVRTYPAAGWRTMFSGVNALPVCALVIPRARLLARLDAFAFEHDLSEDYALFLLILTDPQLPPIAEIPGTFCHISVRESGNTVTMADRRPWVRDITRYVTGLTASAQVAGPGLWSLLAGTGAAVAATGQAAGDLRRTLERREADIRLLRRENARLRTEIAQLHEPAA